MRTLEKGKRYESLEKNIARIAYAYGFSTAPVAIPKRALTDAPAGADARVGAALALLSGDDARPTQSWGIARHGTGSLVSFSVTGAKHPVAHAIVLKAALSIAELSGYSDLTVSISSVGDSESRKRFTRELTNFFRKQHETLSPEMRHLASRDPDAAYRALLKENDPLRERAPRSIDYLSESSRKTMLATLELLESVGVPYIMNSRLEAYPGVNSELIFAIEGTAKDGSRVTLASGGRFDEYLKKTHGKVNGNAIAVSVEVPKHVRCDGMDEEPACFLVHVGDAAKLRTFSVIESLWRAHVAVGQALMAENLREQIQKGTGVKSRYLGIIGQREALDGTIIVRNVATQIQTVLSAEKLGGYVVRGHRG